MARTGGSVGGIRMADAQPRRTTSLEFRCPECEHKNYWPAATKTDSGTVIVVCENCGQEVSARLIASGALS